MWQMEHTLQEAIPNHILHLQTQQIRAHAVFT